MWNILLSSARPRRLLPPISTNTTELLSTIPAVWFMAVFNACVNFCEVDDFEMRKAGQDVRARSFSVFCWQGPR